ncbi:ankyrin repeat domain-containing protein 12 isoform X1 [Tribolium madens]|uniref:ankyrin repeat domain-containing protein 12 isoform X1 n=1 Tax=Tribolium madens TaxID=41895 RepID=UPI001CF72F77|nr:ankyrin repeat domain-containing protein 12 isoform X1 [Tribolium madens]
MPSSVRPKGSGGGPRAPPVTPMSERQQMALLMQMTSSANDVGSRSPSSSNSSRSRDRNERGETPLHLAAIKGDVEQVCKLLAHRADPNATDFAGWTPLHEACNHGWYEVAFRLVQAGANVNAKGHENDTPLHDAAMNGHIKLVKLLVERGADIHAKNSKGKTPLDVATPAVTPYLHNPSLPLPESTASTRVQPRVRDDKKVTSETTKTKQDETMDTTKTTEDVYEFKSVKESEQTQEQKSDAQESTSEQSETISVPTTQTEESSKRNFSEIADSNEEVNDDESRRKKRKEEGNKDGKTPTQRNTNQAKSQSGKQGVAAQGKQTQATAAGKTGEKKSPCSSPKPASNSDAEVEDGKSDLKVPPLKIVIPQSGNNEQETGTSRNGKNSSQRTHPLPYVVASSNSSDSTDKEMTPGNASPESGSKEEKKDANPGQSDEQRGSSHQRVLRSSHRSGPTQGTDRGSNNSSPQLQRSHSPSPSASPATPSTQNEVTTASGTASTQSKTADAQATTSNETETTAATTTSTSTTTTAPVELHPRKRKMKPNKDVPVAPPETQETPAEAQIHPHDQPITNCYQLFLNIRKQIDKRRRGLFPVQPKPPQGFKDYLMNRCTYVLASTAPTTPNISYPPTLPPQMKDLFTEQEKERYRLRMQHVIEKEKLVLSVEQEILRVHGRAARALANQSLPFSVCTILRDEEVYNLITPEQEEKDRNARSRYNGRLFLSWLQDVDDKWEKIKEHMLLRHHNEAESLHAVQKMDWEWKMKELSLCDKKSTPSIDEHHVPMVHVSDDFDLLPA